MADGIILAIVVVVITALLLKNFRHIRGSDIRAFLRPRGDDSAKSNQGSESVMREAEGKDDEDLLAQVRMSRSSSRNRDCVKHFMRPPHWNKKAPSVSGTLPEHRFRFADYPIAIQNSSPSPFDLESYSSLEPVKEPKKPSRKSRKGDSEDAESSLAASTVNETDAKERKRKPSDNSDQAPQEDYSESSLNDAPANQIKKTKKTKSASSKVSDEEGTPSDKPDQVPEEDESKFSVQDKPAKETKMKRETKSYSSKASKTDGNSSDKRDDPLTENDSKPSASSAPAKGPFIKALNRRRRSRPAYDQEDESSAQEHQYGARRPIRKSLQSGPKKFPGDSLSSDDNSLTPTVLMPTTQNDQVEKDNSTKPPPIAERLSLKLEIPNGKRTTRVPKQRRKQDKSQLDSGGSSSEKSSSQAPQNGRDKDRPTRLGSESAGPQAHKHISRRQKVPSSEVSRRWSYSLTNSERESGTSESTVFSTGTAKESVVSSIDQNGQTSKIPSPCFQGRQQLLNMSTDTSGLDRC